MKVIARVVVLLSAALLCAAPASAGTWAAGTIHTEAAWRLGGSGRASVLVGAVDTGVDYAHPALAGARWWTNAAEASGVAGVDDDGDGCVDDVHGCDVVASGGGDPDDDNGHGTATAGVFESVAPGTTVIAAKVLDGGGAGTTGRLAKGLDYVADAGAKVVVVSIGGTRAASVHDAIAAHPETLFVVAAGNSGGDVDAGAGAGGDAYPCVDDADNVVCVAASTSADGLAAVSNWGTTSVDLAAPGQSITAPTLTGTANWTGTSFAAPLVAGVAALAWSASPGATVAQVKRAVLASVDHPAALAGRVATGGRLNAYRALRALRGDDPGETPAAAPAAAPTTPAAAVAPTAVVAESPAVAVPEKRATTAKKPAKAAKKKGKQAKKKAKAAKKAKKRRVRQRLSARRPRSA